MPTILIHYGQLKSYRSMIPLDGETSLQLSQCLRKKSPKWQLLVSHWVIKPSSNNLVSSFLSVSHSHGYHRYILAPPGGLPELGKETTACSVKLEFQINNE